MGYDYEIQYRSGTHNQATDALSRLPEMESSCSMMLSVPCFNFLEELHHQLHQHPEYIQHRHEIVDNPAKYPHYSLTDKLILHRGRIWLPHTIPIIQTLLTEYHSTSTGGHAGITKTLARISKNFTWSSLRDDITQFITNYVDCQLTKYETKKMVGLLCPLPVPHRPWEDLSLDFIVGLPAYRGYTTILVVVDRFSKGVHLGMLPTSHTALMVASLFLDIVVKLHGVPRSLLSDRDPLFINKFWQELFRRSGTQLRLSSTYHPQSDRRSSGVTGCHCAGKVIARTC